MEIYATDPNSTTMSTSHDDWLLNFDSVERNRHRKAAAKRAKSFSLACKPESRSHAEYNQWRQPEAGSRVSSRLYSKAGDHNPTAMPHNRQSYADGMEHRYIQRRPHNVYSEDHSGLLLHGVTSYQPVSVAGQTADGRFPLKSSCSNLSDQYSQDSAYHSRHGSSIDATDPNSVGSDAWLGSGRGQARARFPSCPNANPQSFTTHTEEIVSPRTTRRIFEEAAMRNSSPMRDRTYNKMTLRSSESCQSVNRQNNEVGRSSGSMGSQRFDSVTGQLQRTKSFSAVWSEPNNLASMTHVKQYDRRREWPDVRDGGCFKGNASPIRSRLFYNTMTQTEPEELLGGDAAVPFANRQWFDTGNLGRGNCDLDASGPNTSPKKFSNVEFAGSSLSNDRSDVETMPKKFTSDQATLVFTGSQESGYGRPADVSYSCSSDQDPGRASYSSNQASMMRRLSKELYGQKLGAGLRSRKSFSGDRHARLGSIDENSQSFETPGRNLGTRRKSSSEVEKHSELSSRDVGCQPIPNDPEKTGDGDDDDDDLDLGDGCNFVRNRKPQMSLRKAFGIYDEFEISDESLQNHVPSPKQPLAQFGNSRPDHPNGKPLHDASMQQKGFESCKIDEGFVKSLPQFEAGRQDDSFTQSQSRFFAGFQPRSNVPEVTRIKSASMPRQQTFTLMSPTGGSTSYTGTGVPSTRHSMSSQDDLQYQRTAGEQEPRLSEVRRSVAGSGYSGGFGGQNLFPAGSSGVYDNSHSPRSVPVAARDDFAEDVPDTDSSSHSSTPPPMLPPRRYRKGSAGDVWTGSLGDELAPKRPEPYSGANADFDAESTIKRESYAHQLRQRSHRLSHSAVGSSYLHRRPPPPLTSINTDESNGQSEAQWSSVARSSCVTGNQSLPAFQCFEKSPLLKDFSENYGSGHVATSSWCHVPEQACETPRTFQSTASVNISGTFNEVSTNCVSPVERDDNFSILPSSFHRNSESSEAVAESLDRYGLSSVVGATDDAHSPPTWTSRIDLETTGAARSISDDPEAEVAKTEHYRTSGTQRSEHKKKADMAVVQPSIRLAEFTTEKFTSSSSGCETIKGPSPSKIGKVRGYPRPPGKSPDESAYDCAAAIAPQKLPYEEKSSFEFSAYDTPASVVAARMPEEEIASSGSVSTDARQSQSARVQVPDASFPEDDGPSSERRSGERPRSLVIPEEQRRPTGTILPSPQQQQQLRTTADYMTDLFTKEEDGSTVQSDSLTRNSFQRASLRHRLMTTKQTTNKTEHVSVLPEDDLHIMDRLSQISKNLDDSTEISEEEKLNLIIVLEKKLGSLHEERQLLNDEIDENNALGKLVTTVVEQKLSVKEFDKYKSYVDELEKMLYLILKLSERLAKAENAVQSLPQNASDREKATLISKRNELSEKHADALILKEGIDRRRHQVDTYLRNCLTCDELKDYEYFVKMKAQLVIDRQDVEDRIEMRRRYLELLTSTANSGCALKPGDYFGPKSYC